MAVAGGLGAVRAATQASGAICVYDFQNFTSSKFVLNKQKSHGLIVPMWKPSQMRGREEGDPVVLFINHGGSVKHKYIVLGCFDVQQ